MENINLIRKIAWSFHYSTGLDWDELFQEAALLYLEALRTYDPSRGKITTYMWTTIRNNLKNKLKKDKRYSSPLHSLEDVNVDRPVTTESIIERLSSDARHIAELVLSDPEHFVTMPQTQVCRQLADTLTEQGWSLHRIWCGIHDLKLAFKN